MELRTDDNKGRLCEFCGGKAKSPYSTAAAGGTLN